MNESEARSFERWSRSVRFPAVRGAPAVHLAMPDAIRLRVASTLRAVQEAERSGDEEQADSWLDALSDFRAGMDELAAELRAASTQEEQTAAMNAAIPDLEDVVARLPPFSEEESRASLRQGQRIARRAAAPPVAGGGLAWLALGAGALWMLSRRRR